MIGGYLFGWLEGSAYVLVATTLAATGVFLVARSALGAPLRARAGPSLLRFAEGFRDHAASYVFVLHLVPIFPYAMVIGIPAACGVRMRTFVVSAFLGLLPGTLIFAHLGDGLGEVLSARPADQPEQLCAGRARGLARRPRRARPCCRSYGGACAAEARDRPSAISAN